MGAPAAKLGDGVVGVDTHIVMVPAPGGPVPTPVQLPFNGKITENCSTNVLIAGAGAATAGSVALNTPAHVPPAPATFNAPPPDNRGTIIGGSPTVLINGKPAARAGDKAITCNDPVPLPAGVVEASSTVLVGP
jgi:uncharacterized Zn-binding protein involved in type VI secretion